MVPVLQRRQIRNFFIKLLLATAIFYAWFSYRQYEVWYRLTDIQLFDYYNEGAWSSMMLSTGSQSSSLIQDVLDEIYSTGHQSSDIGTEDDYMIKFQAVCTDHVILCTKVQFVGDFSMKDKYVYLSTMAFVVSSLDDFLLNRWLSLQDALHTVVINSQWGKRRGGADRHNITINTEIIQSYVEFVEVFVHELWHIIDLWVLQWVSRKLHPDYTEFGQIQFAADDWSLWYYELSWESEDTRFSQVSSLDFCSGYGMTNPFEDFAECMNLYLNHNDFFIYIAQDNPSLQRKYNMIASLFDGQFLFSSPSDLVYATNKYQGWRPWDTTRLK